MRIYLNGMVRDEHYEVLSSIKGALLVVDYSFVKTRGREVLFELKQNHSLMADIDVLKMLAQAERNNNYKKVNDTVSDYSAWLHINIDLFDIAVCPQAPNANCNFAYSEQTKAKGVYALLDASKLEFVDALSVLEHYQLISTLSEMPARDMRAINNAMGRPCFHTHGPITKEEITAGLYASGATSSWLTGATFGNTYEYVGALKMNTHHGSKGQGKRVREQFKSRCERIGVSYDALMEDDRHAVNLWNAHQWHLFARDAAFSSGAELMVTKPTFQQGDTSDLVAAVSTSNALTTPRPQQTTLATQERGAAYLRTCNSCFLSSSCPAFALDADCSISTRPRVDTPEDLQQLLNRVIEIQGERVLFAAFAEKAQNLGINPDVSKEVQTLTKIVKEAKEIMAPISEEITIKARGPSVMNQLFGGYGRAGGGGGSKPSQSEAIIDVSPLDGKK